jgi:5-deoxy-glucuronate isomerase
MCESEPHPQVTTPAYAEWYLWCTRLNDEQPLHTTFLPEHEWVNHPSAKLYPHLSVKDSD